MLAGPVLRKERPLLSTHSLLPAPYQENPFKEHRVGGGCRRAETVEKVNGKDMERLEREGNGGYILGKSLPLQL